MISTYVQPVLFKSHTGSKSAEKRKKCDVNKYEKHILLKIVNTLNQQIAQKELNRAYNELFDNIYRTTLPKSPLIGK